MLTIVGRRCMKMSPPAVTTAPPLLGVPIVIGNIEGPERAVCPGFT